MNVEPTTISKQIKSLERDLNINLFDRETKKQLIQKVYDVMEPGGYLFIGRTETIDRSQTPFQLIQPSIFRK